MVSCLGILGGQECSAKSMGPCVQSIDAIFSITNGIVCLVVSSGISWQSHDTLFHGRSRGTCFIHLGFVVVEI